jgi:hypothetical protein
MLHKDLTGLDLHVNKVHADTHGVAGTDPLVLAESQVTDLVADLAGKVDEGDARLTDARTPMAHTQAESTIVGLTTDLAGKAATVHTHTKSQITDFPAIPDYQAFGTASEKDVPASGNASTDQVVKGDDTRLANDRNAADVSAWAKAGTKPAYTPAEIGSPSGSGSSSGNNTGDQTLSGLGAEAVANKSTSVPTDAASDVKYPSVKAVKDYADGLIAGLLNYRGAYDASGNTYPASGGSGTAGAVMKGDMWAISVAGTLGGVAIQIGDVIIAKINTPAQTAANWNTLNTNISYVPEDQANKENTALDTSTTKYPSNAIVKAAVDAKAPLASPALSGTPTAPTAAVDTATTQIATTAMVVAQAASATPVVDGVAAVGVSTRFARGDHVHPTDTTRAPLAPAGATYTPATGSQTVALDVTTVNMHVVTGHASGTAITFTVTGATNNQPFVVSILQGGTTVSTITAWFATIRWAGGTAPTLTATLNKRDTFGFIRTNTNTYDGFVIGQNA